MADIDTISKYLIQHYPDHFALARDTIEVIEFHRDMPVVAFEVTHRVYCVYL